MNTEYRALAEYLEGRIQIHSKKLYTYMDHRFDKIEAEFKAEFKEVHRKIDNQINFVDRKNDEQDEEIKLHEIRIQALETTK